MTRTLSRSHSLCVCALSRYSSLTHSLSLFRSYIPAQAARATPAPTHTCATLVRVYVCVCESVACYAYSSSSSLLLQLGQLPTELPTYLFESLLLHIYDTLSTIQHTRYSPHDNINKNSLLFWQLSKLFAYRLVCLTFSCWEQQLKLALSPF